MIEVWEKNTQKNQLLGVVKLAFGDINKNLLKKTSAFSQVLVLNNECICFKDFKGEHEKGDLQLIVALGNI